MRLLLISNRLPISIKKEVTNFSYEMSAGGLATGIRDYLKRKSQNSSAKKTKCLWIGWPGMAVDPKNQEVVKKELKKRFNSYPVFLPEKQIEKFYDGFCNKTLWPLFHYFPSLVVYDEQYWESYKYVNEAFFNAIAEIVRPDDVIWVHDYQLMLLPGLLRKRFPNHKIGFFLHIPFPAFEIFRLLPKKWREHILTEMLGANLIGFHTHEYGQYFLNCLQRILGYEHNMGKILLNDRMVKIDTFPMGIDFKKFNEADKAKRVKVEIKQFKNIINEVKAILSIDRLDYTKGILNRLEGYEYFLEKNPSWLQKVVLILVVVPSRTKVEHYQQIKRQVDEIVGKINGKYSNLTWTPIIYQYKAIDFTVLSALYKVSDIALVTPLRDGMNLVAKEYIASRSNEKGVLILSEMAGAAKELGEAIIINPNNVEEIAESLHDALAMSEEEQVTNNARMRARLKNYDVVHWADEFLETLQKISVEDEQLKMKVLTAVVQKQIIKNFKSANKRLILLDYDGTLTPLMKYPRLAKPSEELIKLLKEIAALPNTKLVLISGRDKKTLHSWFNFPSINLVAEHGAWIKEDGQDWETIMPLSNEWKPKILSILQTYTDRVPASFIEEKEFLIAWHYRNADTELASLRVKELVDDLVSFTANLNIQVMQGNKVVEVRNSGINKGVAATYFLGKDDFDFILAMGDDTTDEDLFKSMPENGYSIKVGIGQTYAKYSLYSTTDVIDFLRKL